MQEVSEELRLTKSELEEKRTLNEKLEMDLLQLETHRPNGTLSPPGADTPKHGLSDLDLGGTKSTSVCRSSPTHSVRLSYNYRIHLLDQRRSHLHHLQKLQSCL